MEPSLQNCFVTFLARSKEFCGFSTNWEFWNSIFSKLIKKENLHLLVKNIPQNPENKLVRKLLFCFRS